MYIDHARCLRRINRVVAMCKMFVCAHSTAQTRIYRIDRSLLTQTFIRTHISFGFA